MTTNTPIANSTSCVREGMQTPWGRADHVKELVDGVWFVGTPSHGGIKLSRQRNAAMPDYMRQPGGWYEEDCHWAMPYLVFWQELGTLHAQAETGRLPMTFESVADTVRNWNPKEYEQFFSVTLKPGESLLNDERLFSEQHAADLVAVYHYWHGRDENIPEGFFGIGCVPGGRRAWEQTPEYLTSASHKQFRWFLLPITERDNATLGKERGTIADPSRHTEFTSDKFNQPVGTSIQFTPAHILTLMTLLTEVKP